MPFLVHEIQLFQCDEFQCAATYCAAITTAQDGKRASETRGLVLEWDGFQSWVCVISFPQVEGYMFPPVCWFCVFALIASTVIHVQALRRGACWIEAVRHTAMACKWVRLIPKCSFPVRSAAQLANAIWWAASIALPRQLFPQVYFPYRSLELFLPQRVPWKKAFLVAISRGMWFLPSCAPILDHSNFCSASERNISIHYPSKAGHFLKAPTQLLFQ